ncbi:hypothetical protein ACFXTI_028613 [Malus domestica]
MVVEVGNLRSGRCTRDVVLDQPIHVDDYGRKGRRRGQRTSQVSNPDRGSHGDFLRPLGWLRWLRVQKHQESCRGRENDVGEELSGEGTGPGRWT